MSRVRSCCAGPSLSHRPDTARRAFLLGALTHILEADGLRRAAMKRPSCVVVLARLVSSGRASRGGAVWELRGGCSRPVWPSGSRHYQFGHKCHDLWLLRGSTVATVALLRLDQHAMVHALDNTRDQSPEL